MSDAYVAWPVPGVQYASIHIPLRDTYVAEDGKTYERTDRELIEQAHDVASKLYRAFPPPGARPEPERPAPGPAPERPVPSAPRATGTGAFCPEHKVELSKTKAQYDKDGDRFYHPYPDGQSGPQGGKNHTLWWRETVDSEGQSNDGREMPDGGGGAQRQPAPDLDPDDQPF